MKKKPYSIRIPMLLFLLVFTCQIVKAQCDANNFTVTATSGTCPANGSIGIQLPGGSPCLGWQAILTNPGGIETVQNVPVNGGPVNFSSLSAGNYSIRLVNGPTEIPYPGNPVVITTTYQAMDITSSNTAPSCPIGANFYSPDGTLNVSVNSGGTGPFLYEVTSQFGTQSFGPSADTSHVFGNMVGGESVSMTVTDLGCGVAETQTPVIADNFDRASISLGGEFLRRCAPNCTMYDATFRTRVYSQDRIDTIILPGNATISINGGAPQDLTLLSVNGVTVTFRHLPGLMENDTYTLAYNDGCYQFGQSDVVPPIDNNLLNITPILGLDIATCTSIHQISGGGAFCNTNSITIDQEITPGAWVNVISSNSLEANNFSYTLPGPGHYRVTASDDCHTVVREFDTLPETDSLDEVNIRSSPSILGGTGAVVIDRTLLPSSGASVPNTTYEISPVPFVPSITINPVHPFTLGGSYTLNFPVTYNTAINRSIIGDLPLGDYEVKVISCGSERVIPFEVTVPAQYNPMLQTVSGCSNSGRVIYDMGAMHVANSTNDRIDVELWTNDGSDGLGVLVSGDILPNGPSGSFDNLAAGDYVLRFAGIRFQSGNDNEIFSAVTLSNQEREYTAPVSIDPFQNITAATSGTFCDFTDPSSGIILTEVTSGTPTYPMVYELFETTDLNTAVQTFTETDPSVTSHLFQNIPQGDYLIRVTTPCDALDLNLNLMPVSLQVQATADSAFVCSPGTAVDLSISLPQSLYDIDWTDSLGNPLGSGAFITVNVNTTSTYTASYSLKPLFCAGTQVETLSITVPLRPGLSLIGPAIVNCDPQGGFYTLVAELDGTAPYNASGTGAPGTFNGNIWTSDPIPAGTDYNIGFEDVNTCDINITGVSPVCCVFDVVCPTFPMTTVECHQEVPTVTSLTQAEFEALGNGDGSLGGMFCGVIEISAANSPDPTSCSGTITRTYTVTEYEDPNRDGIRNLGEDTILNTIDCSQIISVQDSTAPAFVESLPTLVTTSCENVPQPAILTAIDNCDPNINVVFDEVINAMDSCGTSYTITRNWTAADCTGNVTSHTQIVIVEDNEAPAFGELLPVDMETTCDAIPDSIMLTGVDNCDTSVEVTFTETIANESTINGYEIHRTWTATDCNANETSHTQIISVVPSMEFITQEICLEDDALDLTTLLPPNFDTTGVFEVLTGDGVLNMNSFEPSNFGIGEHQISYSSDTGNCEYFVDFTILVNTDCVVCGLDKITTSDTVTANGDGVNDLFEIKGVESCNYIFKLVLFNRWGNLVYQSNDYRNDWDGSAPNNSFGNSDKLPSGTYYYIITVQNEELKPIDGYIYLGSN
jgi:gliding motility-associated-like protein